MIQIDIHMKLEQFIEDRLDRFPEVSEEQRRRWEGRIRDEIQAKMDDHDVYYDCMPYDVEDLG